jgi:hypothetical protein
MRGVGLGATPWPATPRQGASKVNHEAWNFKGLVDRRGATAGDRSRPDAVYALSRKAPARRRRYAVTR